MEIRLIRVEDTWRLRQKVMWLDRDLSFVKLPEDNHGLHFGLYGDDELISVISLFIRDNEARFRNGREYIVMKKVI